MASRRSYTLRLILCAGSYFVAAKLGLHFASMADAVTLIWAPAGIGLAAVLYWSGENPGDPRRCVRSLFQALDE